jgi:hypothetical protein
VVHPADVGLAGFFGSHFHDFVEAAMADHQRGFTVDEIAIDHLGGDHMFGNRSADDVAGQATVDPEIRISQRQGVELFQPDREWLARNPPPG